MDLRHVRYFLAVAEELNFTRAAARVGIGQPPLSQQIRDLEDELGVRLFHRTPSGAELTEAGQAFLESVRTLPDQFTNAARQAQRAARGETGSIRLGFTGSAGLNPVVPKAVRAFRRAFPGVELTLTEGNSAALADALRDGSQDAAFLRPGAVDLEALRTLDLPDEDMVLVLPKQHPAARDRTVELSALSDELFILTPRALGPTVFDAVITACRQRGFEPMLGQPAPQLASVIALVAAEFGVSIVPQSMSKLALDGVTYREIAGEKPRAKLSLVTRGRRSAAVEAFAALMNTRRGG